MAEHKHYFYTFGESLCRRTVKSFPDVTPKDCQSTEDEILVGGGPDFCSFVVKKKVQYAASKPKDYPTPNVIICDEQLVPSKTYITEEKVNRLFTFTFQMAMEEEEGPSTKRMKIELHTEPSKNEVFVASLCKILDTKELVINTGNIDDTPSLYSPVNRSRTDLYMYHKDYYKQGMTVACVTRDSSDEEESDSNEEENDDDEDERDTDEKSTMTCSGVMEMKCSGKATKQLYAYMLHIGTVKALKGGEIVDLIIVYGLAISYEKRCGWLHKLTIDFKAVSTVIETFGKFSITDAINIIVDKISNRHYSV